MTTELLDLAVDLQCPVLHVQRRPSNERDDRAEGGLSVARLIGQPDNLALLDLERHVVDGHHILGSGVIDPTDVLRIDKGAH
jgi:hypothetical protein